MQLATPKQKTAIAMMVAKQGLKEQKAALVYSFSGERTETSRELTIHEARDLIAYLVNQDPEAQTADTMRKKILSLAHEAGYREPGTAKVDMTRLNDWCIKFGYLHKSLDFYTYKELPALVTQFQKVRDGVLKGV